ncbi:MULTISPECIES: Imm1 family immunity protein [Actinosynnema]|uniref:Imm1 family immunity protein n=1 Tax=Actinosynnema TaxID=40566 RepID=UPI0020A3E8E3|nr:Imm1 family immunity protein [Actinosynnema pretiosum]MCP2096389.1 Immunity protein Imm1 [Actinosynnema pretiosum]
MTELVAWYYPGQTVDVELRGPEDVDGVLDDLVAVGAPVVAQLWDRSDPQSPLLNVGVDGARGCGLLCHVDGDEVWISEGVGESGRYLVIGLDWDHPAGVEVPLAVVRAAVHECAREGGRRPGGVRWRRDAG